MQIAGLEDLDNANNNTTGTGMLHEALESYISYPKILNMIFICRIFRILLVVSLLLVSKNSLSNQSSDTLFKIIKITKKTHYYIIIAQRHDSLFIIISEKVEKKNIAGIERLKKGKCYNLEFIRFYETPLILNYLDINLSRAKIKKYNREIARYHFRIYYSKYLKGIYYTFPLLELE